MTTLNTLHIIDSLGRGGAEQLLVTLLPELARQGVGVGVAVRHGAMDLAPALQAAGVPVLRLRPRHRWNLIGMAREIAGIARDRRADIVHAHLYFPTVGTALMRLLRLSPARTCVTFHNLAYAGANRPTLGLALRRRLMALLCPRGMDRCLAVSAASARHYRESLGLARVDVMPNAVEIATLAPLRRPPSQATGSACRIALPGRIVREKGHADLVAALALLQQEGLTPRVELLGDGPLRPAIEALVHGHGLQSQVDFAGSLEHRVLASRVAEADIVVIPSHYEGFGLTALEAMALGKAVIASDAGGLPDVIGSTGLIVPTGRPDALAEAIGRLSADPALRARLGAEAMARAETEFDVGPAASRLTAVYAGMLDRRGR